MMFKYVLPAVALTWLIFGHSTFTYGETILRKRSVYDRSPPKSLNIRAVDGSRLFWYCRRGNKLAICRKQLPPTSSNLSPKLTNSLAPTSRHYELKNRIRESFCSSRSCMNGQCILNRCRCSAGWKGRFCNKDVNECIVQQGVCQQRCINTAGSFRCHCRAGYTLTDDARTCQNNQAMTTRDDPFAFTSQMVNQVPEGMLVRQRYQNMDTDNTDMPALNATPRLSLIPWSRASVPINYVHLLDVYGRNACRYKKCQYKCVLGSGSERCICPRGLEVHENGRNCKDINECMTVVSAACPLNQDCINTFGSFKCQCRIGYTFTYSLSGKVCKDVNECFTGEHKCSLYSDCLNTMGSYSCKCRVGYTGDGFICQVDAKSQVFSRKIPPRHRVLWSKPSYRNDWRNNMPLRLSRLYPGLLN